MSDTLPEIPSLGKAKRSTTLGASRWLTLDQVATYINAPKAWVSNHLLGPQPPVPTYIIELGRNARTYRWKQDDVDAWMETLRDNTRPPKAGMSGDDFLAALKLLQINNYGTAARALGCTTKDVWAYIQGVEAVPPEIAERVRHIFHQRRRPLPPSRF